MNSKSTFGAAIRAMRKERNLPLRKVAAILDIDPSTLSKIERNERTANKVMVHQIAELFEMNSDELLVSFLSDKVAYELLEEDNSDEVLKVAEEKIEYMKSKNVKQGSLKI
ncbi:MAG: helix-turn-helix transcriptional regulator [Candidatus Paceibacterota bacterium]